MFNRETGYFINRDYSIILFRTLLAKYVFLFINNSHGLYYYKFLETLSHQLALKCFDSR